VLPLLVVAYIESPVPTLIMERRGANVPYAVAVPLTLFWMPLGIAYDSVPGCERFYDAQNDFWCAALLSK